MIFSQTCLNIKDLGFQVVHTFLRLLPTNVILGCVMILLVPLFEKELRLLPCGAVKNGVA